MERSKRDAWFYTIDITLTELIVGVVFLFCGLGVASALIGIQFLWAFGAAMVCFAVLVALGVVSIVANYWRGRREKALHDDATP